MMFLTVAEVISHVDIVIVMTLTALALAYFGSHSIAVCEVSSQECAFNQYLL